MSRWGRDHWSTFAYVETRWVDHHGMLDHDQMRCDSDLHPFFAAARPRSTLLGTRCRKYPTRLKSAQPDTEGRWDVVELANHDDYNCLDDAIHAGLVEVHLPTADIEHDLFLNAHGRTVTGPEGDALHPSFLTGMDEQRLMTHASYTLTPTGQAIAAQLRGHRATGGNTHQFVPTTTTTERTSAETGAGAHGRP